MVYCSPIRWRLTRYNLVISKLRSTITRSVAFPAVVSDRAIFRIILDAATVHPANDTVLYASIQGGVSSRGDSRERLSQHFCTGEQHTADPAIEPDSKRCRLFRDSLPRKSHRRQLLGLL